MPVPQEIKAQYSHFKEMPWVKKSESQKPPDTLTLQARVILETFQAMDLDQLEEVIPLFLKGMLEEAKLIKVSNYQEEWQYSSDEEKAVILQEIAYIGEKLAFFRHLIVELRQQIILGGTHAEKDRRHAMPQFMPAISEFLSTITSYEQDVTDFKKFLETAE
jgi:hypothetical protein